MALGWFKKKQTDQNKAETSPGKDNAESAESSDTPEPRAPEPGDVPEDTPQSTLEPNQPEKRSGLFSRLKTRLSKTRQTLTGGIDRIFSGKGRVDEELLEDLEELMSTSDIGVDTTMQLMQRIAKQAPHIADAQTLKEILRAEMRALLQAPAPVPEKAPSRPQVIMVLGVNGVGKTTTIGKMAARYTAAGKKVLVVAADTFRAAAIEQLSIWAQRAGADIVKHRDHADPAAVAYDGMEAAVARDVDIVLVDTAGRLHTKVNLMEELKKIKRTLAKKIPDAPHETLLVLDATTGQNAVSQVKLFHETLGVSAIALTKLDGTAKGGVVVSICSAFQLPLKFIGIGEKIEDLQDFNPDDFVSVLL